MIVISISFPDVALLLSVNGFLKNVFFDCESDSFIFLNTLNLQFF
ncbi:hypothetical protein CLV91_3026 [Maribacter vaceletii]|uniref:Uncharacterized protein n=1 Tax=Maribacter vaceletii TaxID=1206816 RepID=A0A495DT76_9FLAO|nr:hypothetical protein CLV91_3026 [Maribacter vaceletii]